MRLNQMCVELGAVLEACNPPHLRWYLFSLSVKPSTCSSAGSDKWANFFNKTVITLQPGSPCNDFKGYCDVFMRCRLVDADGPLARLKKAFFNAELYESIAEWIVVSILASEPS